MNENLWKKPKDIGGELQWKRRLSWQDVYFQVSADTIYLYPVTRKGGNRVYHSISLTQVDEISEMGTKISSRSFKIILKMGTIEQFKCPVKKEGFQVQQWIDNLRHAKKFWSDKENLKQRRPEPQKKVTLERPIEPSESLDEKKVSQIFFTLWNGETIGLLVSTTSTFTDIYPRLFSFACETSSCSICKIRHQSCDLWFVDATGSARRLGKDENLTELDKSGQCFVMEHHQKLLVIYFSDSSYKSLLVPSGITANQVLKLDQVASKLNRLNCFDPGLFLRRHEDGKEVLFCMNDNPFKYQEHGKIVARSKTIRRNSLKKSNHEIIAEIRRKEFEKYIRSKKTKDVAEDQLANQIKKSSRMDDELCFFDDHFAIEMQYSHKVNKVQPEEKNELPKLRQYNHDDINFDKKYNNGDNDDDGDDGDHSEYSLTEGLRKPIYKDTGIHSPDQENMSSEPVANQAVVLCPSNSKSLNNSHIIPEPLANASANINHDITSIKDNVTNYNDTNTNHEVTNINHDITNTNYDVIDHDVTNTNQDAIETNNDVIKTNHDMNSINHDATSANHDVTNANHDVTNINHDVINTNHDITNPHCNTNPDTNNNSDGNIDISNNCHTNTIANTNPITNTNLEINPTQTNTNLGVITNSNLQPFDPKEKNLTYSRSHGLVFQEQRLHENHESQFNHPPSKHFGMRRSLSDSNIRYSYSRVEARDDLTISRDTEVESRVTRATSESCIIDNDDAYVKDLPWPTPPESSDSSEDECPANPLPTFTGPTWTFARRVAESVRKILIVKTDIPRVEKLISEDLCKILYELLDHGLKKNFLGISLFSADSNVWNICQTVSKATEVGVEVINRIKNGNIDQKFYLFIRECIQKKILSRWFEKLSSQSVQKLIMKHYEPSAVVLEPEHSKAMEHVKLYLDGLDSLKLEELKARERTQHKVSLIILE